MGGGTIVHVFSGGETGAHGGLNPGPSCCEQGTVSPANVRLSLISQVACIA